MNSFTKSASSRVNKRIEHDLKIIVDEVNRNTQGLKAVVLCGSFGRGEGGVLEKQAGVKILNDYDLVVVCETKPDISILRALSKRLVKRIDIPLLDLLPIETDELARLPLTQFNYDLKVASKVVWGDKSLIARIPQYEPSKLPLREGKVILMNRLVSLLECFSTAFLWRAPNDEEGLFLEQQIAKVMFACCDAKLMLKRAYRARYEDKVNQFREFYPQEKKLNDMLSRALEFRLNPGQTRLVNVDTWFVVKDIYKRTLFDFLNRYYKVKLSNWVDFGAFYTRPWRDRRVVQVAKNFAKLVLRGGLAAVSNKKILELAQIFLVASLFSPRLIIEGKVMEANRYLSYLIGEDLGELDWEKSRRESVKLWYRFNHL